MIAKTFAQRLANEAVRDRELAPLIKISDNYPKLILSTDLYFDTNYEGIQALNLIDWLLS